MNFLLKKQGLRCEARTQGRLAPLLAACQKVRCALREACVCIAIDQRGFSRLNSDLRRRIGALIYP